MNPVPEPINTVLALSVLLALGFAVAQVVQRLRLPSVTGYIIAGLLLGPVGFNVLPESVVQGRLETFTEVALMLVAFGIGETLDLRQMRRTGRTLVRVGLAETIGCFVLVTGGITLVAWATGAFDVLTTWELCLAAGLLAGAVAVATAPASTIAVIRELGATGPVSRLLLSSVAMNNAASITLFGIAVVVARALMHTSSSSPALQIVLPFVVTGGSIAMGILVGLGTDWVVHRLSRRSEVLIFALGAVLFVGGLAQELGLSAMLAGLAAGAAVVNRDRRDVRAFRAINDFEPPIYGIFFALAGVQLHLRELAVGGLVGAVFVVARAAGKLVGAWIGERGADAEAGLPRIFGLGLLTQAGLAIGLVYLVQQDQSLAMIRSLLINVVVASVVVNELVGPPLVRLVLTRAGEVEEETASRAADPAEGAPKLPVVPWTWPKLVPPERLVGSVVFGVGNPDTVPALTRIAVLMANYYHARPLAVHVRAEPEPGDFWDPPTDRQTRRLFALAREEASQMGYPVATASSPGATVGEGLRSVADAEEAEVILLGHPLKGGPEEFRRVIDDVAREALCPVVVVKLAGALHTERILVPATSPEDLVPLRPVLCALAAVEHHDITFLALLPGNATASEEAAMKTQMENWSRCVGSTADLTFATVRTDARVLAVLEAAKDHDLLVTSSGTTRGLRRLFVGSLAEDIAVRCKSRPILMVRPGLEEAGLAELES